MSTAPVFVKAVGMASPLGLGWQSSCAAVRAGLSRRQASPYLYNDGSPIVTSHLRELPKAYSGWRRALFFLDHAIKDVQARMGALNPAQTPLYLALPSQMIADKLVLDLDRHAGWSGSVDRVHSFSEGSYGGFSALMAGRSALMKRAANAVIVAACDSMMSGRRLLRLAATQRLLSETQPDGVVPGEGAVAMVLVREKTDIAQIRGMGAAIEPARRDNDIALRAQGVVSAAKAALNEAGLGLEEVSFRVSDAAGESFSFKEQALLMSRLLRTRREEFPLWLCAESLGDIGVASGLAGIATAIAGWKRRYAPGPHMMAFAGNDEGDRGSIVMSDVSGSQG